MVTSSSREFTNGQGILQHDSGLGGQVRLSVPEELGIGVQLLMMPFSPSIVESSE